LTVGGARKLRLSPPQIQHEVVTMFAQVTFRRSLTLPSFVIAASLSAISLAGCERKERVVDIDTPAVDVEVDRNIDTGEVEVDTTTEN
jgi:hypothetical protein